MRNCPRLLLNTSTIELWPADLLRARGNADARVLAQADWLLRRKRDGRYLAAHLPQGMMPLIPRLAREPGLDDALDRLQTASGRAGQVLDDVLAIDGLQRRLSQLGLAANDYAEQTGLQLIAEPVALQFGGRDRFGRPLWLSAGAARAWRQLRAAALRADIVLDAISGYRSHDYQLGIFERKRARGSPLSRFWRSTPRQVSANITAATPWTSAHRANRRPRNPSQPRLHSPGCATTRTRSATA